jgi:glutamine synthetase
MVLYPQQLRAKTRLEDNFSGKMEDCPVWSLMGHQQIRPAGGKSDLLLKPVFICPDPDRKNGWLVMTEVLHADGTPHETNGRAHIEDEDVDFWFGLNRNISYGSTD